MKIIKFLLYLIVFLISFGISTKQTLAGLGYGCNPTSDSCCPDPCVQCGYQCGLDDFCRAYPTNPQCIGTVGNECLGPNDCPGGCCHGGLCTSGSVCNDSFCPSNTVLFAWPWPADGNMSCSTLMSSCPYYDTDPTKCRVFCFDNTTGLFSIKNGNRCVTNSDYVFKDNCSLWYCDHICNLSAPGVPAINLDTANQAATITWTPGTGAGANGRQKLFVGADEGNVNSNCTDPDPAKACIVNEQYLLQNSSSYYTGINSLTPGIIYYVKVVNYKNNTCETSSTNSFTLSCPLDLTAPAITSIIANPAQSSATITWTPGNGAGVGGVQKLYVGAVSSEVDAGCPGSVSPACVVKVENLSSSVSSYDTGVNSLVSGTVYYVKVINYKNSSCKMSTNNNFMSSCPLSPPSFSPPEPTLDANETLPLAVMINNSSAITRVNFSSANLSVASVNPTAVNYAPGVSYTTYVTGVAAGDTTVTANVVITDSLADCVATAPVTVNGTDRDPWWQAVGGDIHADGGSISSNIPTTCVGSCSPYLIDGATNGTTGAVSYASGGSVSAGVGEISADGNNWQFETSYKGVSARYDYFKRILEDDPAAINAWNDGSRPVVSGVYLGEGAVRTTGVAWNIGSGVKAVILVPNDLVIDQNITVANGGFLAIISSGNITVADSVTTLQGVYIADGLINTCESAVCDQQLAAAGIFTGWGGFNLSRDLATGIGNNLTPAEKFTYRGDLLLNAYQYLLRPHINWKEVAP